MTRHFVPSLLLLLATAAALPAQQAELRLPGLSGGALTDAELARGSHIVVFWTTWSPRGRDIVARVNELVDGFGERVVTVNFQEDAADVRSFLAGKNLRAPVYLDSTGALSKKYRVNSAPWLVLLQDGRLAYSESLPAEAAAVIRRALG
ncbi:MAG: TlpA family protein disulfide reductase [Thermoanaerobaculia bacterium]